MLVIYVFQCLLFVLYILLYIHMCNFYIFKVMHICIYVYVFFFYKVLRCSCVCVCTFLSSMCVSGGVASAACRWAVCVRYAAAGTHLTARSAMVSGG